MNGENMLLFQDIGFWHDLVVEKMPASEFLVQTERYTFLELVENSTMPVFTTDYSHNVLPDTIPALSRVAVPITDPEFNASYYLVCKKEHSKNLAACCNAKSIANLPPFYRIYSIMYLTNRDLKG